MNDIEAREAIEQVLERPWERCSEHPSYVRNRITGETSMGFLLTDQATGGQLAMLVRLADIDENGERKSHPITLPGSDK